MARRRALRRKQVPLAEGLAFGAGRRQAFYLLTEESFPAASPPNTTKTRLL